MIPEAPSVAIRELGATSAVLQLSHPSPSPPTLLHNITYTGGCSSLIRALVTSGNSSYVNITGLGEGSVYSFSVYSVGVFYLSSPQASTLVAQTNSAGKSSVTKQSHHLITITFPPHILRALTLIYHKTTSYMSLISSTL